MIVLYSIAVLLAFIAGSLNGLMDVCMGPFQNSRISHWNAEFWEFFGKGQAWSNKFVNRDVITRVRVHWTFVIKGKIYKLNKPVEFPKTSLLKTATYQLSRTYSKSTESSIDNSYIW